MGLLLESGRVVLDDGCIVVDDGGAGDSNKVSEDGEGRNSVCGTVG